MTPRQTGIVVFAKPPVRGEVKTRLADTIGSEHAAKLASAFLRDTWAQVQGLAWAESVLATTNVERLREFESRPHLVWPQGDGDLGQRVERVMSRGVEQWGRAIGIGADTPGLPIRLLEQAREELEVADAVLGPADDGGFYLIGLRRCPEGLLRDLPWSQEQTFEQTKNRLEKSGLRTSILEPWFDVDRSVDLERLRALLDAGSVIAPATTLALRSLRRSESGASP